MQEYKDIKIGSIVTGYYGGYWRIVRIEDRSNQLYNNPNLQTSHPEPLAIMVLVMSAKGVRPKKVGAEKQCCISYCRLVTPERVESDYQKVVAEHLKYRDTLQAILSGD